MKAPVRSGLSEDAAGFVDAFREDAAEYREGAPDVGAAWARFEEAVEPAEKRKPLVWFGAAAALAAAALLVWVVGSATSMQGLEPEPGQQAPDRAATDSGEVAPSVPPKAQRRRALQAPSEPAAVDPTPVKVPADTTAPGSPAVATPARARATKPETAPTASRLAEELRLLDAMRAASKAGRHADALRMVGEHAAAFKSGSFAAERELAKVRALCGLGRLEQVRAAQSGFAKSHPASHLASLVRSACPQAAKEIEKTDHDR